MSISGSLKWRSERVGRGEVIQQTPSDKRRPWSMHEIATMRKLADLGAEAVAEVLGRSVLAVKDVAHRHRISLRRPGNNHGLVLGQPRGTSFVEARRLGEKVEILRAVRARLLENPGAIDRLEEIAKRETRIRRGDPLCPTCTRNPQEVEATGLCRDCHVRKLAEAHRHEQESDSQRELWAERQRKVRRRRRGAKADASIDEEPDELEEVGAEA